MSINNQFIEMNSSELIEVEGGNPAVVIGVIASVIAISSAAYDFGKGFSAGWNSVN